MLLGWLPHQSTSQPTFGFQVLAASQRARHLRGPSPANTICPPDLQTSIKSSRALRWPTPSESSSSLQILQAWRGSMKRREAPSMMYLCSTTAPRAHQIPPSTLPLWSAPKRPQLPIMQWQRMSQQLVMSLATVEAKVMVTASCPTEGVRLLMKLWWCAAINTAPSRPASVRARWAYLYVFSTVL